MLMIKALSTGTAVAALLLGAVAAPVSASAASGPYSVLAHEPFGRTGPETNCKDTSSNVGIGTCAIAKTVALDKQIDATALAMRKLRDAPAAVRLDAAQKAPLAFRTAECESASDVFEGGSEAAVLAADCLRSLSTDR